MIGEEHKTIQTSIAYQVLVWIISYRRLEEEKKNTKIITNWKFIIIILIWYAQMNM